jgi:putative acetyltransferase
MPKYQKTGIGSILVNSGIERLSAKNINVLFVYGDPRYYGRFGFSVEAATPYIPPYELKYPYGWQARIMDATERRISPVRLSCVSSLNDSALW